MFRVVKTGITSIAGVGGPSAALMAWSACIVRVSCIQRRAHLLHETAAQGISSLKGFARWS